MHFLLLSFMSSLYILDINPLLYMICKNFLPFGRLTFHFALWFPLLWRSFLVWCSLTYLFFSFVAFAFRIKSKNHQDLCQGVFGLCFLIIRVWQFQVMFKSLIHFALIFMYGKIVVQFHAFACDYPVFPTPFIEDTVCIVCFCAPFL